jgi:hypothetical protein
VLVVFSSLLLFLYASFSYPVHTFPLMFVSLPLLQLWSPQMQMGLKDSYIWSSIFLSNALVKLHRGHVKTDGFLCKSLSEIAPL